VEVGFLLLLLPFALLLLYAEKIENAGRKRKRKRKIKIKRKEGSQLSR